ncbi:uncharacterized protein GGS25DRAFT_531353 [Hypoxylon fragiforme]|uniref:uncharacterized protein n=1 Tax=Hypoxylon fragiforme TaxID=63214 RepID=UPI0020C66973|nr:uncharacterized protein GGS25DRAFT_531353 [Hypoxylon fragiforme]KAI2608160.1 hypothetical protein GGS25DRAFT_531353 [Hypoxylon fragiforme]
MIAKNGSTPKNANLSVITDDHFRLTEGLKLDLDRNSLHEDALAQLAFKCSELSKDLQSLLQSLETQKDSKRESIAISLRSMRKKGKLAKMEDMLAKYRSEISARFLATIKYVIDHHS